MTRRLATKLLLDTAKEKGLATWAKYILEDDESVGRSVKEKKKIPKRLDRWDWEVSSCDTLSNTIVKFVSDNFRFLMFRDSVTVITLLAIIRFLRIGGLLLMWDKVWLFSQSRFKWLIVLKHLNVQPWMLMHRMTQEFLKNIY